MKVLISGLIILILAVLQVTFPARLQIAGLKPDLLLLGVIFFALLRGELFGFGAGVFAGLLTDCFSRSILGLNVFLFGIAGLLIGKIGRGIQQKNPFAQIILTFTVSVSTYLLYLLTTKIALSGPPFFPALGRIILPACVYTAVISPLVFFVLFQIAKSLKL